MSKHSVYQYVVNETLAVNQKLFLTGDKIYIQSYDPVSGRDQKVFDSSKEFIGYISSKAYWEIVKQLKLNS